MDWFRLILLQRKLFRCLKKCWKVEVLCPKHSRVRKTYRKVLYFQHVGQHVARATVQNNIQANGPFFLASYVPISSRLRGTTHIVLLPKSSHASTPIHIIEERTIRKDSMLTRHASFDSRILLLYMNRVKTRADTY
ncbi:uncharacterized protein CANTADRAFT_268619 [Suhomyces tanzawaensis NRRL Y-17324]|uniref:Uncharacterized protein n=1 Tax=Suhomyces tanzawaensis NRRL Y-17324 TaxID=984487 RepID=A0A1E4SGE1_9ASCO|nr:uncharacterized protein CANTADRAFT_268619 [Suhomyces tanzawaensis NRRL Y-17324]ODV78546.1 hypothetical protein CANTADRAFT_268619 [Suhomyces tanzawaensis NRRL Y-17324]